MQMPWKILSALLTLVFSVQAYPAASQADAAQPGGAEANRVVAQGCLHDPVGNTSSTRDTARNNNLRAIRSSRSLSGTKLRLRVCAA